MGQYRTVPTEDEIKKGVQPEPVVTEADPELVSRAEPILERMVKFHAAPPPPQEGSEEELQAWRERAVSLEWSQLGEIRSPQALGRDVYWMFGCKVELGKDPEKVLQRLKREVPLSLTEQKERLLDLVDELVGTMVEHACPPNTHYEDWDVEGLKHAYEEQFGIRATGLDDIIEVEELAKKLYADAEAVLQRMWKEFGEETYLRLFRNLFLEEIDRQWIEHLQAMDHLRDGIGLRGYGQRDPKKEYKREGFDMFMEMMQSIKSSVSNKIFRLERIREEDVERIENRRRRQAEARQRQMRANHPAAREGAAEEGSRQAGTGARGPRGRRRAPAAAAGGEAPARVETVRRERPKIGRNDPCWCGSGKKYKQCHWREDQAASAAQ
ncbi:MAG: SEC-C metal-binding domain-containing protein [Myxococcota bacterium]